ncbi:MAG: 4-(cytidine 5'-diphospho)-2-C-methyl-D-erythritol kinase [Bryobacterales bacterium]|nr:4-(cytidine 5'-diphospho)-2-C-methyl-D-erythritol kinase [Bryobacterales bacterium]
MSATDRHVSVNSFAKVNLDLRVLWRRSDGFHEIRTLFHTISLADTVEMRWQPGGELHVVTSCPGLSVRMEENIAHRAALRFADFANLRGRLRISIRKRIPAGGGLGGGSSNAASVLLALPALTGATVSPARLLDIAGTLGSDVPFFLMGGAALGIGRGEELCPLSDFPAMHGLLAVPGIAVSTLAAYKELKRPVLQMPSENEAFATLRREFSAQFLAPSEVAARWNGSQLGRNDFEPVVFREHPELAVWKSRILEAGAVHAMMSGSGSSVFGLFPSRESALAAVQQFEAGSVHRFQLLSRSRYQRDWLRLLGSFSHTQLWPPQATS